jgi:hypothetical protein
MIEDVLADLELAHIPGPRGLLLQLLTDEVSSEIRERGSHCVHSRENGIDGGLHIGILRCFEDAPYHYSVGYKVA